MLMQKIIIPEHYPYNWWLVESYLIDGNGVASWLFWEFFPREVKNIIFTWSSQDEIEPMRGEIENWNEHQNEHHSRMGGGIGQMGGWGVGTRVRGAGGKGSLSGIPSPLSGIPSPLSGIPSPLSGIPFQIGGTPTLMSHQSGILHSLRFLLLGWYQSYNRKHQFEEIALVRLIRMSR